MVSHSRSSSLYRLAWLFPALSAVALAQACANRADDCDANSTCTPPGGTSSAGATATAGKAGNPAGGTSGAGDAGAPTAGTSMNAGAGGTIQGGAAGEGGNLNAPCDGACSVPTPVCNETTDTCVECLAPADCTTGAENKCDTASNTCVECLETADCGTPSAARCEGGKCIECESNEDCNHIVGKGVCDTGTCVRCTAADESACAGNSCNPATKECTSTTAGSVGTCKPCLADSECMGGNKPDPDARCVPMEFQGQKRESGFCLRRAAKTCGRPYTIAISVTSASGAATENYCGIDQDNTTCEAVLDLEDSRTCENLTDSGCGCPRDANGVCMGAGQGGLCRDFAVLQAQCTYQCGVTNDCPSGKQCLGSPTKFCQ
jgi:hypothetical protein